MPSTSSCRAPSRRIRLSRLLWLFAVVACGEPGGTRLFLTPQDAGHETDPGVTDAGLPDGSSEAGPDDADPSDADGPSNGNAGATGIEDAGMEDAGSDASNQAPPDDSCEVENTLRCVGQELQSCGVNGMFQTIAKCRDVDYCDAERGQCRACACREGTFRCEEATLSVCRGCRLGFEVLGECAPPLVCDAMNGTCNAR